MANYVDKVLSVDPVAGKRRRELIFAESVACGFCRGSGNDDLGALCGVCKGHGRVEVEPPVVRCLECRGTGRGKGALTCLACRGVGVVSVPEDATTCAHCHGTGEDGVFYCTRCRGQGIC